MLPIDEHAESLAWVYVRLYGDDGAMYKVSWCEEGQCFAGYGRGFSPDLVTHYLPASWVENAAKMREALETLLEEIEFEIEQRQDSGNAEDWAELEGKALSARTAIAKARGGAA